MSAPHESLDSRVSSYGFDQSALMARRQTLVSLLRSLHKSLEQNDAEGSGFKSIPDSQSHSRNAGIKNMVRHPLKYNDEVTGTTISHRGVQLSQELHDHYARSQPGKMTYKDFRAYLAAVGRSSELAEVTENKESFAMYMNDLGAVDIDGDMTAKGMVKYRALTEQDNGLELDLLRLNMNLLPRDLTDWNRNKTCFDRIDCEQVDQENIKLERRIGKKRAEKECKSGPVGKVETQAMQQLLADTGNIHTYEQIENFQLVNRAFYQVMAQMCARNLRKNEFATNIQASKINVDDTVSTYRDGFLAWMVSGRPKPPVNKFEKFFIWAKTSSVRYLLEASRTISAYRSSIQKLCQREIFSPRLLGGLKMDVASLSGQILIGSEDEVDEGMSANLTYTKIERAAQEFAMMKLPKGTGTAFIVDLLIMSDASKSEVHAAVLKITQIIQEHLDNEIQKLPLFHSWKVFAYKSDVDDTDVIRLTLCFDRAASIDYALRELDMGFAFSDLLTELSIDFRSSLSIVDLLDSKRVTLEKDFHFLFSPKLSFARSLFVKIVEELLLFAEEEKKLAATIQNELDTNQAKYDERTAQTHPDNPEFGRIRIGIDARTETKTGQQLETQQMREEMKRRRNWRWVRLLRGTKGMEWDFSFKNVTDAFFGSKLVKGYMPDWLQPQFFKQQGSATETWRRWSREINNFMVGMFTEINDHQEMLKAEKKKKALEEANRLGGMSELAQRREQLAKEKKALANRLEALGIKMDPNLLKKDTKEKTGQELRNEWKTAQTKSQLAVLQMYAALKQCCVGVVNVTVISGTNKFELNLQGFDIFEVAPEVEELEDLESLVGSLTSSQVSLSGL